MALFGSMLGELEDDPFFGSHMRNMRHMNNMMNSLFSDPFSMMGGGGPLAITGPRHGGAMMPFMPQMLPMNRIFTGNNSDMDGMSSGSSFTSSTFVMSSGPNGKPQVISSSSSTKIGPNGIKETRKTHQDSRTGTKKMSIGHHIGERAHLIEREQNYYSGDAEERQEFINIEEEEAEEFDREFQTKAGSQMPRSRAAVGRITHAAHPAHLAHPGHAVQLALPAPPLPSPPMSSAERGRSIRPAGRRPLRSAASLLAAPPHSSTGVRNVYGHSQPQRHRHRHNKSAHRYPAPDN